jgi:hypothetical protein
MEVMELTAEAAQRPSAPPDTVTPARRAAFVLGGALAAATVTQALFWRTGFGLNFLLWTMLTVACCLASVGRWSSSRVTPSTAAAIGAAVVLSFSVFRFAGVWTSTIAVPTTLLLLGVLPLALRDQARLADVAALPLRALRSLKETPRAMRGAANLPGTALGGKSTPLLRALKGLIVGFPVTAVFVGLLSSDADFSSVIARIQGKLGEGLSFATWTLITAASGLTLHVLHQPKGEPERPRADAPDLAYRVFTRELAGATSEPAPVGRVAVSTWSMVVGQVAAVFALFVVSNLKNLFGGSAIVRAERTMTYAKYLHAGVGQLLFATVLSLCLVAVGHRLLLPRGASVVPGGTWLRGLEGALLGLTAITVVSCAERLAIYEDAYGATRQRLGVAFVILGVLGALAVTMAKVVRRGWGAYAGTLASFFVGLMVVASLVNADEYVARTNLDRAARGKPLDAAYLATLSTDARAVLSHPVVAARPELHEALAHAYCRPRSTGWRALRGIGSCSAEDTR